jgi:hypothetical protein
VKHRVTDHNIGKAIRKGHVLNGPDPKVICRESGSERSRKLSNMLNAIAVQIERKDLATLAEQVHQIAPEPASGVQNTHARRDVPSQNLIKNIDVNLSEPLLNAQDHASIISASMAWLGTVGS